MVKRMTADDAYGQPHHNQPESGALSSYELATIEAGRTAMQSLQKTFDLWITVGRAVKTLREKADRMGGRLTFQRLMRQQELPMDGTDRVLDPGTVTRLIRIIDNLADVTRWHEQLPIKQKREYASPSAVFKHCPLFAPRRDGNRKPSPYAAMKATNIELQEQVAKLEAREDGDTFKPSEPINDIAKALHGTFQGFPHDKGEKIAKMWLKLIADAKAAKRAKEKAA
jgi:hypothetical protein